MSISHSDCEIQGKAQDRGTSSNLNSILWRRALTWGVGQSDGYAMIDMLPDETMLEIFDAYRDLPRFSDYTWDWDKLVHVCRRWRQLVFASPLRLQVSIHLDCTKRIDVKKTLGCWPAFPITVDYTGFMGIDPSEEDNLLAALEHSDRVHHLYLHIADKKPAKLAAAMQKPFPMLTKLQLSRESWTELALPQGFLGGSAPRLQQLELEDIIFPELPNFLLSTRDLVTLDLSRIPPQAYIPPETMVTCLAPMSRLTCLVIGFRSTFPSDQLDVAPVTRARAVLPALVFIFLDCNIHYMEDLAARIDCPQLNRLELYPSDSSVDVDLQVPQIFKLINRSKDPLLACFDWVNMDFSSDHITLRASHKRPPHIAIYLSLMGENWQLSHVFQAICQFSTTSTLSNLRYLSIHSSGRIPDRTPTNLDWAPLLAAFSALKAVYISGDHKYNASALESIDGDTAAALLPALDLLYVEGLPVLSVDKFCAARQASGLPVTVVDTADEFFIRQEPYIDEQEKKDGFHLGRKV